MAKNKNFVERNPAEPQYETLTFNDLRHADGGQGDWLSHIMLGYIPAPEFEQMCKAPGWNPEQMQVAITINGIPVIHASFEAMISEFSGRMLKDRMQRGKWDSFDAAVEVKAKTLLKQSMGDFLDNANKLSENVSHLADSSDTLIQAAWNAPYKWLVTEEMKAAGQRAIADFGPFEATETNQRICADKVFSAMTKKRPDDIVKSVKIKLPRAIPYNYSDRPYSGLPEKAVTAIRADLLKEVFALLESKCINVEL